jgi:hypothetical protein
MKQYYELIIPKSLYPSIRTQTKAYDNKERFTYFSTNESINPIHINHPVWLLMKNNNKTDK